MNFESAQIEVSDSQERPSLLTIRFFRGGGEEQYSDNLYLSLDPQAAATQIATIRKGCDLAEQHISADLAIKRPKLFKISAVMSAVSQNTDERERDGVLELLDWIKGSLPCLPFEAARIELGNRLLEEHPGIWGMVFRHRSGNSTHAERVATAIAIFGDEQGRIAIAPRPKDSQERS